MRLSKDRLYSEKEVAKVLRRAAEFQEKSGFADRVPQGADYAEIVRIGEEIGIDAEHISAALQEIESSCVEESQLTQIKWLGAPEEYFIERSVPGQLDDGTWDSIVGVLNAEYKQAILGVSSGNVRTWHWKHELGSVHMSAIQAREGVRLKLNVHIDDGIVAGLIPTVILGFAGVTGLITALSESPLIAIVVAPFLVFGLAFAFRRAVASWWKKDRKKTAKLFEKMIETAFEDRLSALAPGSANEPTNIPLEQCFLE